jgi:hypothetical protein
MQFVKKITICLILFTLVFVNAPVGALAVDITEVPEYPSPIVITEIQTGAGSAGDEFVELYNTEGAAVDITDWQVRYLNATSAGGPSILATIQSDDSLPVLLQPGEYYVLYTASVSVPTSVRGQTFSAKLSSAEKVVALFAPNTLTCKYEVQDALAWGTSLDGEGSALMATGSNDRLITRYIGAGNYYVDRNDNLHDAKLSTISKDTAHPAIATGATPGAINTQSLPVEDSAPPIGTGSSLPSVNIDGCILPDPEEPDNGLNPPDEEPPSSEQPEMPETPEPSGPKVPAADIGLKSPQLTELLPNPGKPLTDASDEFVELYNSNNTEFDLSGFVLEAGAGSTKRRYIFAAGTMLPAKSFKAFFSVDTHLSLSNTQGLVRLLDPLSNELSTSTVYGAAKDNQAWALVKGNWQWSTRPTPNAANILIKPMVKAKKSTKKSATAKTAAAKTGSGVVAAANTSAQLPEADTKTSLHTGVLALIGGFALLYGAYEYRSDVANKLHQLRLYRTARREARQSAKRR